MIFTAKEFLKTFIVCFGLLLLKMFYVALGTANARRKTNSPAAPEDSGVNKDYYKLAQDANPADVQRFLNIHRNDLENIVPVFIATILYINSGLTNETHYLAGAILVIVFTVSRFLHTIFYLYELQPWRTIAFIAGLISTVILVVWAIVNVLLQ